MSTLPLFDPDLAAHARDPWSSFDAAEKAKGLAADHHRAILRFLNCIHPQAAHYRRIAEGTGLDPVQVGRRLIELERGGLIERFGKAPLGNGRSGETWRLVREAE